MTPKDIAEGTSSRFAKWVTKYIIENGIANCDLARMIEVHDSLIGHYRKGTRAPTLGTLAKLRATTGLDLNALVDGTLDLSKPKPKEIGEGGSLWDSGVDSDD